MNKNYLLPGEPLRKGVDLIADKKSGALIVIGTSNKLDKISSGGINLKNCEYSPEMLSELAKMDGAIIVDESVSTILKANVHLNPSDSLQTSETGTRHRTAERVSIETNLKVIAVSEESSAIKVFHNMKVNELEAPAMILGRVNESLQSVDRMRRRFDEVLLELGELEIEDTITNQQVLTVIQRGELLTRLANQVKNEAKNLGEEAGIVMIQIESLESGVENTLSLVLKDHLPSKKYRNIKFINDGGWHFNSLLTPKEISSKLRSFAHQEFSSPEYTNEEIIKENI